MEPQPLDSAQLDRIADQVAEALTSQFVARMGRPMSGLGIFECEDYKCDDSFTCSDYKCSGGGFKCNDVFKISAEMRFVAELRVADTGQVKPE